jgi:hypothetical protein
MRKRKGFGSSDSRHIVAAEKEIQKINGHVLALSDRCDEQKILAAGATYGAAYAHVEAISDRITQRALRRELTRQAGALERVTHTYCAVKPRF